MNVTLPRTPVDLPPWLCNLLEHPAVELGGRELVSHRWRGGHSNDVRELTFHDGSVLMVKRARHTWGRAAFDTAAAAADLITRASPIRVPRPLAVPRRLKGRTVKAYWRLPQPTLLQLWPDLTHEQRRGAVHSLGRLLRCLHDIPAPAFGPITARTADALQNFLTRDLQLRLLPAVYAHWPEAAWWLERVIERVPEAAERAGASPVLTHSDLHLGNVLCEAENGVVRCIGLLDLDAVTGCCGARDLATFEVLHGPLFLMHVHDEVAAELQRGYGAEPDPLLLSFFRCVQLANQGFHSALLGDTEHAAWIHEALDAELNRLSLLR